METLKLLLGPILIHMKVSVIEQVKKKDDKRVFNLLWGVNQGCSLLLARRLEKGQPGVLVNPRRRLNAILLKFLFELKLPGQV